MMKRFAYVLLAVPLLCGSSLLAAETGRLNWSAWEHLPVFDSGRMKPLDTFARGAVDSICGTTTPKLSLAGAELQRAEATEAEASRSLFSGQQAHEYQPGELLLSWLVESEKWECVPFLRAKHPQLREELLGLPTEDAQGKALKYVSPRQVEEAMQFREYLDGLFRRQEEARKAGNNAEPIGLDKAAKDLFEAYALYRRLTFNPQSPADRRSRFIEQLVQATELWRPLEQSLSDMAGMGLTGDASQSIQRARDAFGKVAEALRAGEMSPARIEPPLVAFREAVSEISAHFAAYTKNMFEHPPEWETEQLNRARASMNAVASQTGEVVRLLNEAQLALYDNGHALRILPALNPAALEGQRDVKNDAQPWLSFQTAIYGSEFVLAGYPKKAVERMRSDFAAVAAAYTDRGAADRRARFNAAMPRFAASVRAVGEGVEPVRAQLALKERDEALIAATAYPPADDPRLAAEVHYNQFDPFFWGFVIGLAACASFGMAFGWLRRPLFWFGLVTLVAAQWMLLYAFGLRIYITGWAPVTNMFETVVFVALVVAILGLWFALQPMLGPGMRNAWRMTALPHTWEATVPDPEQAEFLSRSGWSAWNWALLLPRALAACAVVYLLAMQPYGQGEGYTVIALAPRTGVGTSMPTFNDIVTWLVGLAVLVPSAWFVPRFLLAGLLSLATVPLSLVRSGARGPAQQVLARQPFALAGAMVGVFASSLAYFSPIFDKDIGTLMPVLRDNFWLTIHVLTITASYGAGLLAWGLGLIALGYYLFGRYRQPAAISPALAAQGHRPADGSAAPAAVRRRPPPQCEVLAGFTYKAIQVSVLLLAAGTIFGALWADVAWGRFWGWDPKEVWALVSLLTYVAVLHARFAGWAGNFGLACASVVGATMILMAWYGVNFVLGAGLHTYGSGAGGQVPVTIFVVLNWLFMGVAAIRYRAETHVAQTDVGHSAAVTASTKASSSSHAADPEPTVKSPA